MHILAKSARDSWTTFCVHNMVINMLSLIWSCSVWESFQQFGADLPTTILAILNSCQSFGTVPMQRLASKIGKLRQFAQLFAAIPTLLVAIRHHATLPRAICRNRQNGPSHILQCIATDNISHLWRLYCDMIPQTLDGWMELKKLKAGTLHKITTNFLAELNRSENVICWPLS